MTNVLVTSAGRRVSLLKAFMTAAHARGGRVLAGDLSPLAPTLFVADEARRLPAIRSDGYIDAVLDIVRRDEIQLVVPTIDTELGLLAKHRERFRAEGCLALVSDAMFIGICADKHATEQALSLHGIAMPRSWTLNELELGPALPERLFVKPRRGSASVNTHSANPQTVRQIARSIPDPIVQEELFGPEITVDALLDLDGKPRHFVPRHRIRTMSGESIQGRTLDDPNLKDWVSQVLTAIAELGAIGPVTLQAFLTPSGPILIEINPRFGGGFPLTHAAGGHYPEWILGMLADDPIPAKFDEYTRGLYMTRYHVELFTKQLPW